MVAIWAMLPGRLEALSLEEVETEDASFSFWDPSLKVVELAKGLDCWEKWKNKTDVLNSYIETPDSVE